MQAVFNELSAVQLAIMSEEQAKAIVLNLIQVCKQLQAIDSTFIMRINEHFWRTPIGNNSTIMELLNNSDDLREYRNLLYAVSESPYLPDQFQDIDEGRFFSGSLYWKTIPIDADSGIRAAYAFDPKQAPMISFATDDWRDIAFINVKIAISSTVALINMATIKQIFEVHFETITTEYLKTEIANPTSVRVDAILPNKNITNEYLDYLQFYVARKGGRKLNNAIAVTKINEIGGVVAKINGWMRHNQYSMINKREVFFHIKNKTIFITIDREKGDFEVHNSNKNDNHLGAISFDGEKTEPSKGHKLKFEYDKK